MSQSELKKTLDTYFAPTSQSSVLSALMTLSQKFAFQNKQNIYVQFLFDSMQNSINKDTLKKGVKKYFILINRLLYSGQNSSDINKYRNAVSKEIVNQQVLKHNATDIILDFKIYRLKWAKKITDQAFNKLHQEAVSKLSFRLDRGIPEEEITKIENGYKKRNFSKKQIQRYLPGNSVHQKQETRHEPQSSEESQQISGSPKKKVKKQRFPSNERQIPHSHMMSNHSSYFPTNSFAMPQTYPVYSHNHGVPHPYYPHQPNYPPQYPSYSQLPNMNMNNFYQDPKNYYKNHPSHAMPIKPPVSPYQAYPVNYRQTYHTNGSQIQKRPSEHKKVRQILDKLRLNSIYECKICGVYLSTEQSYQKHSVNHFEEAQKSFEMNHNRNSSRRINMPQIQQWINSSKIQQVQLSHILPIQQGTNRNVKCKVCKGEMVTIWSDQFDSWAFQDAIVAKVGQSKSSYCHYSCYQTVEDVIRKNL